MRNTTLVVTTAAAVATLLLADCVAANELDARRAALETCVLQQLPAERAKADPQVRRILGACEAEVRAFRALLPPGAAELIWEHVEHVVRHKLAE